MAITCTLCGKKQSGWIEDFPLAPHLQNFRICINCHEKMEKFGTEKSNEAKDYFLSLQGQTTYPSEVSTFMEDLLSETIGTAAEISAQLKKKHLEALEQIKVTSGYNFEGHEITEYLGFISSETALGMGLFKSISAGLANMVGSESMSLSKNLRAAKEAAITDLKEEAYNKGANAIIGMALDYTMFADSIVGAIVSGTAVIIK